MYLGKKPKVRNKEWHTAHTRTRGTLPCCSHKVSSPKESFHMTGINIRNEHHDYNLDVKIRGGGQICFDWLAETQGGECEWYKSKRSSSKTHHLNNWPPHGPVVDIL